MGCKFPICNYNEAIYDDWLLSNSASLNAQKDIGTTQQIIGALTTILGLAGMAVSGGGSAVLVPFGMAMAGVSVVASGEAQIKNANATDTNHQQLPNSATGLAQAGDINFGLNESGFFFYHYSVKQEYAKIIDEYFDMYGYKVNSLETPNLHTRTYWNFLKILDPNIEGTNVPESDMIKYKEQLKQGITFWHDSSHFRDYSQTNSVIT